MGVGADVLDLAGLVLGTADGATKAGNAVHVIFLIKKNSGDEVFGCKKKGGVLFVLIIKKRTN